MLLLISSESQVRTCLIYQRTEWGIPTQNHAKSLAIRNITSNIDLILIKNLEIFYTLKIYFDLFYFYSFKWLVASSFIPTVYFNGSINFVLWWTSTVTKPVFAQLILHEKEKAPCIICRGSVLLFLPLLFHCQTLYLFLVCLLIWFSLKPSLLTPSQQTFSLGRNPKRIRETSVEKMSQL